MLLFLFGVLWGTVFVCLAVWDVFTHTNMTNMYDDNVLDLFKGRFLEVNLFITRQDYDVSFVFVIYILRVERLARIMW